MTIQSPLSRTSDATSLLARVVVGVAFVAHGWPKATDIGGTADSFEAMGVPLPQFSALLTAAVEVGGGLALAAGVALPLAGVALALLMAGAYSFAHVGDPLVGGFELALVMGAASLALGFSGGRFAVDRILPWGRRSRHGADRVSTS